jgi:hypothetical protein
MSGFKTKAVFTVLALALFTLLAFGTSEGLAATARIFCASSTAIFAVASIFGLATRLRA